MTSLSFKETKYLITKPCKTWVHDHQCGVCGQMELVPDSAWIRN